MSELKSRPPVKPAANAADLDAFLNGAEKKVTAKPARKIEEVYPWEKAGVREDVTKVYNVRLPEPYLLKLKYIAEHTPNSMQKFCLNVLKDAIDKEIENLSK